jgi:alpha/beta superfamily hydrolase
MRRTTPLLLTLALVMAACGDTATDPTPAPDPASTTATTSGATVTAPAGSTVPSTTGPVTSAAPPDTASPVDTGSNLSDPIVERFSSGQEFLEATVWLAGETWIVLGHMLPADRGSWTPLAMRLQEAGYSVLAYDNRGYGGSTGTKEPFDLLADATAAIDFARSEGAGSIVYGGASMNGAAALYVGAIEDLAGVFTLSAVPSFSGVPAASDQIPEIVEPMLFVAAEDDGNASNDAAAFDQAAATSTLLVYESGGHGTTLLGSRPELIDEIVTWLGAILD